MTLRRHTSLAKLVAALAIGVAGCLTVSFEDDGPPPGDPICGDGAVDEGEACDEGDANADAGACKLDCTQAVCGDDIQAPNEECDLGTQNADDGACTSACVLAVCGDELVQADEEKCDDGNEDNDDDCTELCLPPYCGDGILSLSRVEGCDDGNQQTGDGCHDCRRVTKLAYGPSSHHACAILSDGALICWGANESGQLGLGDTLSVGDEMGEVEALQGVDLGGLEVKDVALGRAHTCALLESLEVKCWGANAIGQLGLGNQTNVGDAPDEMGSALEAVDLGDHTVTAIAAGYTHTCAILDDQQIKCWGSNDSGELGLGDRNPRGVTPGSMGDKLLPVQLGAGRTAAQIALGNGFTCALLDSGDVKCWGSGDNGQLGQGSVVGIGDDVNQMGDNLAPIDLAGFQVEQVRAGSHHACAVLKEGGLKCWGLNLAGQLGIEESGNRGDSPFEMGVALPFVALGEEVESISLGSDLSCALLSSKQVKCWGDNEGGGLGLGDLNDRGLNQGDMGDALPIVSLGRDRTVRALSAGSDRACVLLDDDTVKCWGDGDEGRSGAGSSSDLGDQPGEMGDALQSVPVP